MHWCMRKAKKGTRRAARLNWDRSARQTRSSARARTWHWVHRSRFSSSWSGNERETQQQSRKSRGGKNPAVGCLGCSQSPLPYMARSEKQLICRSSSDKCDWVTRLWVFESHLQCHFAANHCSFIFVNGPWHFGEYYCLSQLWLSFWWLLLCNV